MKFLRGHFLMMFILSFFFFPSSVETSYPSWQTDNSEDSSFETAMHSSNDGKMDLKSGSFIFGDVEHRETLVITTKIRQDTNEETKEKRNVIEEHQTSPYTNEQKKRQADESFVDKFFKRNGLRTDKNEEVPLPCKSDTYCDDGLNRVCVKTTIIDQEGTKKYESQCVMRSKMISMIRESSTGDVILAGSVYKGYYYDCNCDVLSVISDSVENEFESTSVEDEFTIDPESRESYTTGAGDVITVNQSLEGTVVLYRDPHYTEIYDSLSGSSGVFLNHHRIYAGLYLAIDEKDCRTYEGSIRKVTLTYLNPSGCCNIEGFFVWNHHLVEDCFGCEVFKEMVTIYDLNDPDLPESKEYDVIIETNPLESCIPKISWFAINKWGPSTKVKTTITWDVIHVVPLESKNFPNEHETVLASSLKVKEMLSLHQGTHSQKAEEYSKIREYYKIKSYGNVHRSTVVGSHADHTKKGAINRNTKIISQLESLKDVKYKFMPSMQDIPLAITCGLGEGWDKMTDTCVETNIQKWLPGMRDHKNQLYWLIVFFAFFFGFALVAFLWGLCLHHHHRHQYPHLFQDEIHRRKDHQHHHKHDYHSPVDL